MHQPACRFPKQACTLCAQRSPTQTDCSILPFSQDSQVPSRIRTPNALTDAPAKRSRNVHVKKEIRSEEDTIEISDSTKPPILSFSMVFTPANKFFMAIPKDFALKTGIAHQKRVVLLDPKGTKWSIDLRPRKDGRMKMINGWDDFQKAFKLALGVTCTFEFIESSGNVLNVQVKRGRGRPPKMEYYDDLAS